MAASQEEIMLNAKSPEAQQLLGRALALLENSGLKATLLKTFTETITDQIIYALCIQYIAYAGSQEVQEELNDQDDWDQVLRKLTPEKLDRYHEFISMYVVFYNNEYQLAEHPVDLKDLDFGQGSDPENEDLIKLIVFMLNRHLVSDAIYNKWPDGGKHLQLSKVLTYANMYLDHCQENGTISVYSLVMNQPWIIGLREALTSKNEEDKTKGVAK